MKKYGKKVWIYELQKELNIKKEDTIVFKTKLVNLLPYYNYLKDGDEPMSDFLKRSWFDEYEFNEPLLMDYFQSNQYSYIKFIKAGDLEQIEFKSLYYILVDQSIRLWLLKSSNYEEFIDFNPYYEWLNLLFLDKEKFLISFERHNKFYVKADNYSLVKNIFSNYEFYNNRLYKEAKSKYIQLYLKNDQKETIDTLPILSHYESLLLQMDELKESNKIKEKALRDLNELIKIQELTMMENLFQNIENDKYDYPLSKLFSFINQDTVNMKEVQSTIFNLYVALNKCEINSIVPLSEVKQENMSIGWKYKNQEIVSVMTK